MTPEFLQSLHENPTDLYNRLNSAVCNLHEISQKYLLLNRKLEKAQRSLNLVECMIRGTDYRIRVNKRDIEQITERLNQLCL